MGLQAHMGIVASGLRCREEDERRVEPRCRVGHGHQLAADALRMLWCPALLAAAGALFLAQALLLAGAGALAFVGLFAFAGHLVWQIRCLDVDDPDLCLVLFRSNRDAGWLLFAGLVLDAARSLF